MSQPTTMTYAAAQAILRAPRFADPEPLKPGDRVRLTKEALPWIKASLGTTATVQRVYREHDGTAMVLVWLSPRMASEPYSANCWERIA